MLFVFYGSLLFQHTARIPILIVTAMVDNVRRCWSSLSYDSEKCI